MPKPIETVHLHRFHDFVAFCTEETQTLYLSVDLAKLFAEWLLTYAADVERCAFTDSTLGTQGVEL